MVSAAGFTDGSGGGRCSSPENLLARRAEGSTSWPCGEGETSPSSGDVSSNLGSAVNSPCDPGQETWVSWHFDFSTCAVGPRTDVYACSFTKSALSACCFPRIVLGSPESA